MLGDILLGREQVKIGILPTARREGRPGEVHSLVLCALVFSLLGLGWALVAKNSRHAPRMSRGNKITRSRSH